MNPRTAAIVLALVAAPLLAGAAPPPNFKLKPGAEGKLCLDCHSGQLEAVLKKPFVHTPVKSRQCIGCHNPHASEHGKLLAQAPNASCAACHKNVVPKAPVERAQARRREGLRRLPRSARVGVQGEPREERAGALRELPQARGRGGEEGQVQARAHRAERLRDLPRSARLGQGGRPAQGRCPRPVRRVPQDRPARSSRSSTRGTPSRSRAARAATIRTGRTSAACSTTRCTRPSRRRCAGSATTRRPRRRRSSRSSRGSTSAAAATATQMTAMFDKGRVHRPLMEKQACLSCHTPARLQDLEAHQGPHDPGLRRLPRGHHQASGGVGDEARARAATATAPPVTRCTPRTRRSCSRTRTSRSCAGSATTGSSTRRTRWARRRRILATRTSRCSA